MDFDALLVGLLENVSFSRQEGDATAYLVAQMAALGYDQAFIDAAGNAVGILGTGEREIVLLGHIDTVPGVIPVKVIDDQLYGRGAVDAKGPLAAFTAGAIKAGAQTGWKIIVIGAVEEEAATSKGARYVATQYHPSLCIIGEPSSWDRVTLGYKGRALLECRVSRPISHTARPEANAIEQAVAIWNAIKAHCDVLNQGRERAFDQVMVSLRTLRSSEDGFTESADMTIGFRLPLDVPPDALKAQITPLISGSLAPDAESELSWRGEEVAYRADKNTELTRLFLNAIRDGDGKPGFLYKTGTSDMNVVAPVWNCPIAAYGPGDSAFDHTPEEHIPLADYHRAIDVIANVLRGLNSSA